MSKVFSEPPTAFVAGGDGSSPYAKQLATMEARFLGTRREIDGWRKVAIVLAGIAAVTTGRQPLSRHLAADVGACGRDRWPHRRAARSHVDRRADRGRRCRDRPYARQVDPDDAIQKSGSGHGQGELG